MGNSGGGGGQGGRDGGGGGGGGGGGMGGGGGAGGGGSGKIWRLETGRVRQGPLVGVLYAMPVGESVDFRSLTIKTSRKFLPDY